MKDKVRIGRDRSLLYPLQNMSITFRTFAHLWVAVNCLLAGFLVLVLIKPGCMLRGGEQSRLCACKSNLKNIATAIEMYGTDFEDSLPPKMESLTPNYLRTIPQCPAYGDDTSVPMWFISPPGNRDYVYQLKGDEFEVYCTGEKHRAAKVFSKDFPRLYSDSRGITEKPEAPVPESTPTPHDADD